MKVGELFILDPTSPSYVARTDTGRHIVQVGSHGYYCATVKGNVYLMHRVVFELTHGWCPPQVDHENMNKLDNRPDNLRPADHATNKWNTGIARHNTSGVKGLSYNNGRKCWVGSIWHYKTLHQKYSKDREVVERWLVDTRNKLHGEFANHGQS